MSKHSVQFIYFPAVLVHVFIEPSHNAKVSIRTYSKFIPCVLNYASFTNTHSIFLPHTINFPIYSFF